MTGHPELIDKQRTILLASGPGINRQCHRMNVANILLRAIRHGPVTLLALLISLPAFGAAPNPDPAPASTGLETVEVFRTNWIPRIITNVIEIRMPTNRFISEYRTNRFVEWRTNVIDVYRTNRVTRTRTNTIAIEQIQTNLVTAYQTNLNIITQTNWTTMLVFKTNWVAKTLTNSVTVEQTRTNLTTRYQTNVNTLTLTNLTTRYQTNVNTLTLTNWETVLVIKTNRVKQLVTNWTVEAARTEKPPAGNQVEVQLKLKSAGDAVSTLPLQEWRVERTDGSVILFGQGQEFKRELPPGTYKVQVTARLAEDSPPVRVHASLEVTREGVTTATARGQSQ